MIVLQIVWHTVHWQIGFVLLEINPFHCVENLSAELRLKHVVILRLHVHNELSVVRFRALGDGLDGSDRDLPLDLVLLDVVEAQVG